MGKTIFDNVTTLNSANAITGWTDIAGSDKRLMDNMTIISDKVLSGSFRPSGCITISGQITLGSSNLEGINGIFKPKRDRKKQLYNCLNESNFFGLGNPYFFTSYSTLNGVQYLNRKNTKRKPKIVDVDTLGGFECWSSGAGGGIPIMAGMDVANNDNVVFRDDSGTLTWLTWNDMHVSGVSELGN